MEVKGHQRSNVVNYVLWLPNLVRRIPDASLWWWWWPSWRSKVIRGQMRKVCAMATKLGQKNPWCEFIMMMMTFMEVKGHQRSNVVNYVLWLPNLVRRIPDASLWWWWPSWRSKVIRGQMQKLCAMATKLGQKNPWCEFIMMMTFMEVKGHQRSNVVNFALWLPNLVNRIANASFK